MGLYTHARSSSFRREEKKAFRLWTLLLCCFVVLVFMPTAHCIVYLHHVLPNVALTPDRLFRSFQLKKKEG